MRRLFSIFAIAICLLTLQSAIAGSGRPGTWLHHLGWGFGAGHHAPLVDHVPKRGEPTGYSFSQPEQFHDVTNWEGMPVRGEGEIIIDSREMRPPARGAMPSFEAVPQAQHRPGARFTPLFQRPGSGRSMAVPPGQVESTVSGAVPPINNGSAPLPDISTRNRRLPQLWQHPSKRVDRNTTGPRVYSLRREEPSKPPMLPRNILSRDAELRGQ